MILLFAPAKQERSSVGSERFSHIEEEVIGSSPIVPTPPHKADIRERMFALLGLKDDSGNHINRLALLKSF